MSDEHLNSASSTREPAAVAELQRSNRELEQFASVAAHDLRSPLFTVSACIEELVEGERDAQRLELLSHARDAITHMRRLITENLICARAGKGSLATARCSSQAALEAALASIADALKRTGAGVTHDPLPEAHCDQTLLTQLFQNLLENSIKYRSDRAPSIHISAKRSEAEWTFSVVDNGVGIPQEHLEDIFDVFKRFRGEGSEHGIGLGLGTCRRIVERHGGRIWAESTPGEGAHLFFTLPDQPDPTSQSTADHGPTRDPPARPEPAGAAAAQPASR